MDRLISYIINTLFCLMYRKEYKSFTGITDVEKVQREKLFQLLEKNKNCKYGLKFDFENIRSIEDFQAKVPLTTYEDYSHYIEAIKLGDEKVLTSEKVLLLEPTSGSSTASKLVPYTKSLKKEFQNGLKPWLYNLYTSYPGLRWGKSYWSVTPAITQMESTPGGIPIGFEEDSAYFGNLEQKLMDHIFAVPGYVAKAENMEVFYHETSLNLLACNSLTLISVWNPTFLILLLEYMYKHAALLTEKMAVKDQKRARVVAELLAAKDYHRLWPSLKVISCWCDANAASYAEQLQQWFPDVDIQPKGLLATEGMISFPIAGETGTRLSLKSHFFEFRSVDNGKIYLAHQLRQGKAYEVIITTSGGLYRYQLRDIIEVTGLTGVFPLIRFKGKGDKVSDLFGEKLHETFVQSIVESLDIHPTFYLMAPEKDHYVLYIKADHLPRQLDIIIDKKNEGKISITTTAESLDS